MATKPKKAEEHLFQIELKSKNYLKSIALPIDEAGNVLIEGFLGKLESLSFAEGIMLQIRGNNGTLRLDFTEKELKELLPKKETKT